MEKSLSLIYPYYENSEEVMATHINRWSAYSETIRKNLYIIIVDDCSPNPLLEDLFKNTKLNIECYRILQDIRWNVPGAKNLASFMCNTDWMFHSYLDYLLPEETIQWFFSTELDEKKVYWPTIYTFQGKPKGRHLTCMFIHRDTFWDVGGYDEDFAGSYGYDDTVLLAVQLKHIPKVHLQDIKILDYTGVAGIRGRGQKHEMIGKNLILNFAKDPQYEGLSKISRRHLRFPWSPVFRKRI